jgi:hypothetical protein
MLLEVLPSRHEKPLIPWEEYLLLRTAAMKVLLTRPGEKRKAQSNQTWFSYRDVHPFEWLSIVTPISTPRNVDIVIFVFPS